MLSLKETGPEVVCYPKQCLNQLIQSIPFKIRQRYSHISLSPERLAFFFHGGTCGFSFSHARAASCNSSMNAS